MGGCRCTFRGCPNSTILMPGMHFFHFPVRDIERCEKWASFSNNLAFLQLPISQLRNKSVCQDHFKIECFMNYKKDRLTKSAIPTIMPLPDGQIIDFEVEKGQKTIYETHCVPPTSTNKMVILNENLKLNNEPNDQDFKFQIENRLIIEKIEGEEEIEFVIPSSLEQESPDVLTITQISEEHVDMENSYTECNDKYMNASRSKRSSSQSNDNLASSKKRKRANAQMSQSLERSDEYSNDVNVGSCDKVNASAMLEINNKVVTESNASAETNIREIQECLMAQFSNLEKTIKSLNAETVQTFLNGQTIQSENQENFVENLSEYIKNIAEDNSKKQMEKLKSLSLELDNKIDKLQSVSSNQPVSSSTVAPRPIYMERTPAMNKLHLFNGIKKYLNPSMVALLRMEMFGGHERKYKPDEKIFSMELLKLDGAYEYMRDEWRFRLPPRSDIEAWLKERDERGYEVDWDDC